MVWSSALITGFAASAWAESTASSERCELTWDDVADMRGASGRAADDGGKS
jgi:hypothetical protein